MSEPHWTSYVGMATGLIGAALGILAWRRSLKTKQLDLRLELRKSHSALIASIDDAPSLIEKSLKSKAARASAEGWLRSGKLASWESDCSVDHDKITKIAKQAPNSNELFRHTSEKEMEDLIVSVNRWLEETSAIISKHQDSLTDDAEASKEKMRLANNRYNKV